MAIYKTLKGNLINIHNSQWENNVDSFYKQSHIDIQPTFTLKPKESANTIHKGGVYKKNEAAFYGEKMSDKPSSKGSVFQRNAAHFYGYETPLTGQRPFEVPPADPNRGFSRPVLAQRNVNSLLL